MLALSFQLEGFGLARLGFLFGVWGFGLRRDENTIVFCCRIINGIIEGLGARANYLHAQNAA